MLTLSQQLESIRNSRGISKVDLAAKADISRSAATTALMESEDARMSTFRALARALDLEIMAVPSSLADSVSKFVAAGGKALAQPAGIDAPLSRSQELQREMRA